MRLTVWRPTHGQDSKTGTPVLLRDLGTVSFGPDIREGVAEWQGEGEAVGGIVVMRTGENAQRDSHCGENHIWKEAIQVNGLDTLDVTLAVFEFTSRCSTLFCTTKYRPPSLVARLMQPLECGLNGPFGEVREERSPQADKRIKLGL